MKSSTNKNSNAFARKIGSKAVICSVIFLFNNLHEKTEVIINCKKN